MRKITLEILNVKEKENLGRKSLCKSDEKKKKFYWKKLSIFHKKEMKRNQIDMFSVNVGHEYASSCT